MRWRWTWWRSRGWRTPGWRRIVVVVGVWRMGRLRVLTKAVPRVSCERIPGILKYKTNNVLCKNFPCQFMLIFIAQFVKLFSLLSKKTCIFTLISSSLMSEDRLLSLTCEPGEGARALLPAFFPFFFDWASTWERMGAGSIPPRSKWHSNGRRFLP